MTRWPRPAALVLVAGLALTACASGSPGPGPTASGTVDASPTTPADPAPTSGPPPDGTGGTGRTTPGDPHGSSTTEAPGRAIAGLPGEERLAQAREDVANLTLEQLAGQLVVASYQGTDPATAAALVERHHLGGVITLGDNVPSSPGARVEALRALTGQVGDAVAADGRDWPAFLGIDQEGGPITRVGAPLQRWPSAMALGAADRPDLAREVATASGRDLRSLGYTVVFAPVADVTSGPDDPTIGARSPGSDPDLVARTAAAQAAGFAQAGLVPVAKHFPGHGSVTADTHLGSARQGADLATLRQRDLAPFEHLADQGLPSLMTAHIVVAAVDPEAPATLSAAVLTELLREDLGFEGLVVTDALNMAAVSDVHGSGAAAVEAVRAGADVLLMPPDPGAAVAGLVAAVEGGELSRERLEDSAARMVATLRDRDASAPATGDPGAAADLAHEAAGAAITQLSGPCGERLVGDAIRVSGGTEADRAVLAEAAAAAGLGVGSGDLVTLIGAPDYQAGGGGGGAAAATGDVVVALDVPYPLAGSTARTALLAAFGRDQATMSAVVEVLTGEREAVGRLPVDVDGDHLRGSGCTG